MYEEGKKLEYRNDRKKRVARLKKMIVGLVITLIAVPTILCIVLAIKLAVLKGKVNDILEEKDRLESTSKYVEDSSLEDNTTENNQTDNSEQATGEQNSEEQTTQEATTQEQTTERPTLSPDGKYA